MPRKSTPSTSAELLSSTQLDLLEKSFQEEQMARAEGPVECLGIKFPNDAARREYFLKLLAEKLKNPQFRKVKGCPIGTDEDILSLSDPPYYTACPNPWLAEFVAQHGTPYDPTLPYHREPFTADVRQGKNHPIYDAHSYHTKVPHRAIMRFILHYTEPGDVIFDGFCGTGMTGVAARLCGDRSEVEALGYEVAADGTISDEGRAFSKLGTRNAVLNDLSPAATFIASNYISVVNMQAFESEARKILDELETDLGWMYRTTDTKGQIGRINFTVWSDVFICSNCQVDVVFLDAGVDEDGGVTAEAFDCPHCGAVLSKSTAIKRMESVIAHHGEMVSRIKKVPVNVDFTTSVKRTQKKFGKEDEEVAAKIASTPLPPSCPFSPLDKEGEQYKRDALHLRGMETVADFYTRRNLIALAALWSKAATSHVNPHFAKFWVTSIQWLASNMYRFRDGGGGGQQGKLTIPSLIREQNVFRLAREKLSDMKRIADVLSQSPFTAAISTGDAANPGALQANGLDYAFIDPPFGGNIFYSDLNCIWEGWLNVRTAPETEAVVHRVQTVGRKDLHDYSALMLEGFKRTFAALKPGRWMTVEFSNSKASVWNSIQTALQEAGFVVANVAVIDKIQRSFRSVTSPIAVKEDLIISAYKPNGGLESRFARMAGQEQGAWEFARSHLKYLPVAKENAQQLEFVGERDPRIIFDRMVAFYIQHGMNVPMNSAEFQAGLEQRFIIRDGMAFLPDQASDYDRKKLLSKGLGQRSLLVDDERSAIDWLTEFLKKRPSESSDTVTQFMEQLRGSTWKKGEQKPELEDLLRLNFISYNGTGDVPSQIHSYLSTNFKECRSLAKDDRQLRAKAKDRWYVPDPSNAVDLERLRERELLRDFDSYRTNKDRIVKEFRLEALRAGFKKAWQDKDYATIIAVAAKIPDTVIQEDPKLLMWHSNARTRAGVDY